MIKYKKKAFSLIELLVAITIGGIILTVVMGNYIAMVQTTLRLDLARQLQKEANFAVIRMADRVRNYSVDLGSSEKEELVIRNDKGRFEFLKTQKKLEMDGQSLFSSNIVVDEVIFGYSGSVNPAKLQPWVSIYLKISSKKHPEIGNWVKTTISSRIFE